MLEPQNTISLTMGQRSIFIMGLNGHFVGLIDGVYYVRCESAEGAVAALIGIALRQNKGDAMTKTRVTHDATLVEAARRVAGHTDSSDLPEDERVFMDEARRDLSRPSAAEIASVAKKLADQD